MDREFDSQHVLEHISQRNLQYVVPKRMRTSEKETARRLNRRDIDRLIVFDLRRRDDLPVGERADGTV
jgi:hypothetical protein